MVYSKDSILKIKIFDNGKEICRIKSADVKKIKKQMQDFWEKYK